MNEVIRNGEKNQNEVLNSHGFDINVDRARMAKIATVPKEISLWLTKLPERLSFRDPVTLIVGENGSGKTSFARAVVAAFGETRTEGRNMNLQLEGSEPANAITTALKATEMPQGNILSAFIEGSEIMFKSREWAKEQARLSGEDRSATNHQLSSRQLFEQSLATIKRLRIDSHRERVFEESGGDVVIIFDEPEQGLSPKRQMDLAQIVTDLPDQGDMLLVPTNNIVLYLSDLPRLDLEHPERGIFRPSAYGENGRIEFPQSPNR